MTIRVRCALMMLAGLLLISGCRNEPRLVGAWRSKITFRNGPLAGMKGLEFLSSYNAGGTMTESSNYDEAANSSPPAYGVWKQLDPHTFQTKYMFYTTQAPAPGEGAPGGADWWPAGHGILTETITLSDDGQTYTSTIKLATFDRSGAATPDSGEGTGAATRSAF
jgi:hypothetical protein